VADTHGDAPGSARLVHTLLIAFAIVIGPAMVGALIGYQAGKPSHDGGLYDFDLSLLTAIFGAIAGAVVGFIAMVIWLIGRARRGAATM
jgi:hypothetical protein